MKPMEIKIYYEDTDAGGVVYYANYLRYFERVRTELLESLGVSISQLAKEGVNFVVVKTEVNYISAAKLGDVLLIATKIIELKKVSLTFEYEVTKKTDNTLVVKGITKLACVNNNLKPIKIPPEIYNKIKTVYNL
ncbi:MAG: YbgC/FadM family acyl-CoA thioesterase [Endomicrobia bacterium]|nr:YbgC/FadM family acyl-CoA thioesterase [Endomicrobiia bacterium]